MADDRGRSEDPRLAAARYRTDRDSGGTDDENPSDERPADSGTGHAGTPTAHDRVLYVETVIQQAIRRGEFDDPPGAGKPIEGLGATNDPDWWIRRKIRTEQLTGLGPPALRLRIEHAEFDAHVDTMTREDDVREYTLDFSRRVVEARRQLQGGPPVVTPTRDPDTEVTRWRERRTARATEQAAASTSSETPAQPRRWWRRRSS
ncbi:hypothetical protein BKA24_002909 [Microbacterium marinum]|uniref:DnaJ homologue subfamily C member 28 conserved domain-containing protein n=1 Tax=Microbacterium marinum TaxID=421115 RepID=A0A7W7BSV9_9MICO|nr:DUF1992 domain-containing protein [Microbacterium marinum]MBB4668200.1 hypothetical protein [Microbacterium marinum]